MRKLYRNKVTAGISSFTLALMSVVGLQNPSQAATYSLTIDCTDPSFYQTFTEEGGGSTGFYTWSGARYISLNDAATQEISVTWQNCEQGYVFGPGIEYNEGLGFGDVPLMPDPITKTFTLGQDENASLMGKRASGDQPYVELFLTIYNSYSGGGGGGEPASSITSDCTFNGSKNLILDVSQNISSYSIRERGAGIDADPNEYLGWIEIQTTFGNFGDGSPALISGDETFAQSYEQIFSNSQIFGPTFTFNFFPVDGTGEKLGTTPFCSITFNLSVEEQEQTVPHLNNRAINYFVVQGFGKKNAILKHSMKTFINKELFLYGTPSSATCTGTVRGQKWNAKREALALARAKAGCDYVSELAPNTRVELKKRLIKKKKQNSLTVRIKVTY